jgi:hypothetical protein
MKKIIVCAMALALLGARAYAQDEFTWRSKPVLCGETHVILENLKKEDYTPMGKSTIIMDGTNKQMGFVWFLLKDDELLIIENFKGVSCLISVSKDYTPLNTKKENDL